MKLILASNSPRRKELLEKSGYKFTVKASSYMESDGGASPKEIAVKNAEGKARDVFDKCDVKDKVVLGADTIVVYDGKILGKPDGIRDAVNTLKMLSGKTHDVITGYAVISENAIKSGYSVSRVRFKELSDELINSYVESGLPLDKAGSYGIQDGYPIVDCYMGSLTNIIGLPMEDILPLLQEVSGSFD